MIIYLKHAVFKFKNLNPLCHTVKRPFYLNEPKF